MNCENCKLHSNAPENVPYFLHEAEMARSERMLKRLWITVLILIFLLVGTNGAWMYYENSFEDVITTTTIEAEQDGAGINIISNGDVGYGSESEGY